MSSAVLYLEPTEGSVPLQNEFPANSPVSKQDAPALSDTEAREFGQGAPDEPPRVQSPIIRIELARTPKYLPHKAWLGTVTEMTEDGFVARLKDYSGDPDLLSEFSFDEVSSYDRDLVEVGSEFYWNLGYKDALNGQRERYAILRFRRLPKITKEIIKSAQEEAADMLEALVNGPQAS